MPELELRSDPSRAALAGDFGEEVCGEHLVLPSNVIEPLAAQNLRTAEEAVAFMQAFPSAMAAALGWDVTSVTRATQKLMLRLRMEEPRRPPRRVYGARAPRGSGAS